jgi:hypothetical protein
LTNMARDALALIDDPLAIKLADALRREGIQEIVTRTRRSMTGERLTNNVALAKELDSPVLPDGGRTGPMKLASFGSETDPVKLANPSPDSGGASNDRSARLADAERQEGHNSA